MTNYKKVIIYVIVIVLAYTFGVLRGNDAITGDLAITIGGVFGIFTAFIGRHYFWRD